MGKVSMIIVVEGISAAGKTTWCRQHAAQNLIKESYPEKRPDRHADPSEAARLWTEWNSKRWSDALAMEQATGVAVCDTDPLKLHFSWALWQIGEAPEAEWLANLKFAREAIQNRRLGFADQYLFKRIDSQVARAAGSRHRQATAEFRPASSATQFPGALVRDNRGGNAQEGGLGSAANASADRCYRQRPSR